MIMARYVPMEDARLALEDMAGKYDQYLLELTADKYVIAEGENVKVDGAQGYRQKIVWSYLTPAEFEKSYAFVGILPNTEFQEVRRILV